MTEEKEIIECPHCGRVVNPSKEKTDPCLILIIFVGLVISMGCYIEYFMFR